MIFLFLAVLCSTVVAVVFKLTEGRMDRLGLLSVNYVVAAAISLVRLSFDAPVAEDGLAGLVTMGAVTGALFLLGFTLFSRAIGLAGISIATATMRLAVVIPFLASWILWAESLTLGRVVGMILAGLAFVLISRRPPSTHQAVHHDIRSRVAPGQIALVLLLLFVVGGLADTSLKVFEEVFAGEYSRQTFMSVTFCAAAFLGLVLTLTRRRRGEGSLGLALLPWGVALGLVNYGSVDFMLLALAELPGTLAFPVNNVATVSLTTALGVAIWREKLTPMNLAGLAVAAAALVLLTR